MEERVVVDSSFSAVMNAPLQKIDIPVWCISRPDEEYQGCSPAHFAAGSTTARDGLRMSSNVEVIGGSLMVQHYVEVVGERRHLVRDSVSDLFTAAGRTKILVTWELGVKRIDAVKCEFTYHVRTRATDELRDFLARQGISFDVFRAQRQPVSIAHIKGETPLFAASIERHSLHVAAAA
jgi:hypothetical protein